jgi:hypothetical protein
MPSSRCPATDACWDTGASRLLGSKLLRPGNWELGFIDYEESNTWTGGKKWTTATPDLGSTQTKCMWPL